jgi:hypothetical protein
MTHLGWDVHSYTTAWTPAVREFELDLFQSVTLQDWNTMIHEIEQRFGHLPATTKLKSRYKDKIGGYLDPKFENVNIARMLELLWKTVCKLDDPSIYAFFEEVMKDVGLHCVQGDSHRIFAALVALVHDEHNQ